MNTQSIDISLYQKGDIALEDIYKKFKNCFMRYAGKVLSVPCKFTHLIFM